MSALAADHPTPTPLATIAEPDARAAVQRMRRITPEADPLRLLPDVPPQRVPRHVAIIMDGNGRWANQRKLERSLGHAEGALRVRPIFDHAGRLGVECLTLYSFSAENWKRPPAEVGRLMELYVEHMDLEREHLRRTNSRFRQIGSRDGLPEPALDALDRTLEATAEATGPLLCLAINYSSRAEITGAARDLARRARAGEIDPDRIDESTIAGALDTAGLPDPDLLIRTAGEMRLSNYLLWQISYAELHVTDVLWPDFTEADFDHAIRAYASRERRFGGLSNPGDHEPTA